MPQWNCACANCEAARAGRIPSRTQSSIAVSADGAHWFLINASPDLRGQIETLAPGAREGALRRSPVEAMLLSNADLDHVLGLVLLREGERLTIHATSAIRASLAEGLGLDRLLDSFCGLDWHEPSPDPHPLFHRDGSASGLMARAISLPGSAPRFAARESDAAAGHSVAWQIADESTGARALIAPHVSAITSELGSAIRDSALVLFDGTFWSDDELQRVKPSARTATAMGHLPVRESLTSAVLRHARRAVFVHINNTNAILMSGSPERTQVEAAGLTVGEDGMEFEL